MKHFKLLLSLLLVLVALLVVFIDWGIKRKSDRDSTLQNNDSTTTKVDVTMPNKTEVVNNGGNILEYDGYVYYLAIQNDSSKGFKNKICRRSLKDGSKAEVLYDGGQYVINERLFIFNHNLFFSISGQTLYINLENKNKTELYNSGVLYSMQDGKMIYSHQNRIYKAEYYHATLAIRSVKPIVNAISTFMFEDENYLYFYSSNEDNSKSIFSIHKGTQTVKILTRFYLEDAKRIELPTYIDLKDEICCYKIEWKNEKEAIFSLVRVNKETGDTKSILLDKEVERFLGASEENLYFESASTIYTLHLDTEEISEGLEENSEQNLYTLKQNGKNIVLYKNDEMQSIILGNIEKQISNVKLKEIGEYVYIEFDVLEDVSNVKEYMLWRIKKDGSGLERLNQTF